MWREYAKPTGIVQEDLVDQKKPNLMQALKETPELPPAWKEQAGLVGKSTHERVNPQCG